MLSFNKDSILPTGTDLNDVKAQGCYVASSGYTYTNEPPYSSSCRIYVFPNGDGCVQFAFASANEVYFRKLWGGTWSSWQEISVNFPSFYKNYVDLNSLANALGVYNRKEVTLAAGESVDIDNYTSLVIIGGNGNRFTGTAICVGGYGVLPQNIIDVSSGKVGVGGSVLNLKNYNDSRWEHLEIVNVSDTNINFWYYSI